MNPFIPLVTLLAGLLTAMTTPSGTGHVLPARHGGTCPGYGGIKDAAAGFDTVYIRDTVRKNVTELPSRGLSLQYLEITDTVVEIAGSVVNRTIIHQYYLDEIAAPSDLRVSLAVAGITSGGTEERMASLRLEEFPAIINHSLLTYIFFDPDSSDLGRYERLDANQTGSFRLERVRGLSAMTVHFNILNIIGQRMRNYPKATLTITGCNSNTGAEKGNTGLSRARAESVKAYLTTVWHIAASRLNVESAGLPPKPSNPGTPQGQEENRRVEILADTPEITDPVAVKDTILIPSLPTLRFRLGTSSSREIAGWSMTVWTQGTILKEYSGPGTPPATIEWDIIDNQVSIPRTGGPIQATLYVIGSLGETVTQQVALPVEMITLKMKKKIKSAGYSLERFNLIQFNAPPSEMTAVNTRILKTISSRLKPDSQILIESFSDKIEESEAGRQVLEDRANATAAAIGRAGAIRHVVGTERLIYDNYMPEGRFYSRTVKVTLRSPLGK